MRMQDKIRKKNTKGGILSTRNIRLKKKNEIFARNLHKRYQ